MPTINRIVETAIYVEDLERSGKFYERFGFESLLQDDRMRAYSIGGQSILLLFKTGGSVHPSETPGGTIPPHDARGHIHFAFAIDRDAVEEWERWLEEQSIALESKVVCPRAGGVSLYFRDPDGHAVELITSGCWAIY